MEFSAYNRAKLVDRSFDRCRRTIYKTWNMMKHIQNDKKHWGKAIASFILVLLMMPLGHALMILMEHMMSATSLHYSAFAMGAIGLAIVIIGVFVKGDTRQTLYGLFGGMLFWTGWVEFLFMYYANRFGTQPLIDPQTGEIITRPEYLIIPASFGFWIMIIYYKNLLLGTN